MHAHGSVSLRTVKWTHYRGGPLLTDVSVIISNRVKNSANALPIPRGTYVSN